MTANGMLSVRCRIPTYLPAYLPFWCTTPADRPSLAIRWGISTSLNSPGRRDAPQQLLSSLRRDSSSFAQCIRDLLSLLLTMANVAEEEKVQGRQHIIALTADWLTR